MAQATYLIWRRNQLLGVRGLVSQAGAPSKRYAYAYDKAGNRVGEQIDDVPNQGTVNNLNQLLSVNSAGPTRFAGWMSETGTVKVAGNAATMTTLTNFVGSASLSLGTNVAPSGDLSIVRKPTKRYEH